MECGTFALAGAGDPSSAKPHGIKLAPTGLAGSAPPASGVAVEWKMHSGSDGFKQLNAIAEGVGNIKAMIAFQWLVGDHGHARLPEVLGDGIQMLHQKGRMGLLRRPEVCLHPEMDAQRAPLEPRPAPFGEIGGLGYFSEAEEAGVERTGQRLPTGGHGKLHMVKTVNPEGGCAHGCLFRKKPGNAPGSAGPLFQGREGNRGTLGRGRWRAWLIGIFR